MLLVFLAKWLGSFCYTEAYFTATGKTWADACCKCSDYVDGTGFVDCVPDANRSIYEGICECRSGSRQIGTHNCKLSKYGFTRTRKMNQWGKMEDPVVN